MYSFNYGLGAFGVAGPEWYQKLVERNPKAAVLTPWDDPGSYGKFFSEGWQLKPNIRYVTPSYDTLDYIERAVEGIRKYNEQAKLWVEQLPGKYVGYRDSGRLFIATALEPAYEKAKGLIKAIIYNSREVYGLRQLPWDSHVSFLGWTIQTIIKAYNLSKRYANAFKNTVKTGVLDPNLTTLPDLAAETSVAALEATVAQMDKDPEALDTLQDLGVLPAAPAATSVGPGFLPPTMPDPKDEDAGPGPKWYWWAGAFLLGLGGAGALSLAIHVARKRKQERMAYAPPPRMLPPPREVIEAEVVDVTPVPAPGGPRRVVTPPAPPPPPAEPAKPAKPISVATPAEVAKRCGSKGLNRKGYSICASRVMKGEPVYLRELQKKHKAKK